MSRATAVIDRAVPGMAVGVVAVTAYATSSSDVSVAASVAIVAVSVALLLQWRSKRRDRGASRRDRDEAADGAPLARPALPAHPEPGEYHCQECGACVTVGPSGTEYGHEIGFEIGPPERCPRRPTSVDPPPDDVSATESGGDRASALRYRGDCDEELPRSDADDRDLDGEGGARR